MSFKCLVCGKEISGSNCAYTLAYKKGWKKIPGCYYDCKCGFPVRAKEIRNSVYNKFLDNDRKGSEAYIYCETENGQGHVYYGTFDSCIIGNGLAASGMSSCKVFERYLI
jgi:hypothetical protein